MTGTTNMTKHIDIVAYLYIAYGVLLLSVSFIVVISVIGGGLITGDAQIIAITSGIAVFVGLLIGILAIPAFAGGIGLLKRHNWARIVIIALSILSLFSIPIGTALGIYALWVLFQDDVQAQFE